APHQIRHPAREMLRLSGLLARVMSQANEYDAIGARIRPRPGRRAADLGEPLGPPAARGARRAWPGRAGSVGNPVGRPGHAQAPRRDDTGGTGRAREGAAALQDARHLGARRIAARAARAARLRPAAGRAHRDRGRPGPGDQGATAARGVAGAAARGAVPGRACDVAGGRAHTGEAQPVLTRPAQAGSARRARFQTFRSLATRNYRLFATGQVVSNTGTWMQRVAQDWLVLELTHGSGTALGVATGLQFLPQLLFSLWGGVIADRYRKRNILLVTQAIMGLLALILGVLALTGVVAVWQVYLLAFALGLVAVVDNPTRQTFVAEMVGSEGMANAIALNSATFNLARIAGPGVAGLVIGAVGTPAAFLVNAASYGAVLGGLRLMRVSELRPLARAPKGKGQLREALGYVRARPELWLTLVLVFFVATFGMNFQVTTALMATGVFHTAASEFGLASAMFALGARGAGRRPPGPAEHAADADHGVRVRPARSGHRPDAGVLVVPGDAGADRPGVADVQHRRQLHDPARHHASGARPGHGPVHARLPRWGTARLPARRLGRRAVRRPGEPGRRRGHLGGRGRRRGAVAGPVARCAPPLLPPPGRARPGRGLGHVLPLAQPAS